VEPVSVVIEEQRNHWDKRRQVIGGDPEVRHWQLATRVEDATHALSEAVADLVAAEVLGPNQPGISSKSVL